MKICIINTALAALITFASAQVSMAQMTNHPFNVEPVNSSNENETATMVHDRRKIPLVSQLAITHHEKHYIGHSSLNWYIYEDGVIAKFELHHLKHSSLYANNGHWQQTIVNYPTDSLPEQLKETVKAKHPEFDIVRGFEVHTRNTKPWMVVLLENGGELKQLAVFGKRLIPIERLKIRI